MYINKEDEVIIIFFNHSERYGYLFYFVCIHWANCISEYSKVKLERNYVQLFYCQPLNCLRTTHLIR